MKSNIQIHQFLAEHLPGKIESPRRVTNGNPCWIQEWCGIARRGIIASWANMVVYSNCESYCSTKQEHRVDPTGFKVLRPGFEVLLPVQQLLKHSNNLSRLSNHPPCYGRLGTPFGVRLLWACHILTKEFLS